MATCTITILQRMHVRVLQNCYCACDHFVTEQLLHSSLERWRKFNWFIFCMETNLKVSLAKNGHMAFSAM